MTKTYNRNVIKKLLVTKHIEHFTIAPQGFFLFYNIKYVIAIYDQLVKYLHIFTTCLMVILLSGGKTTYQSAFNVVFY